MGRAASHAARGSSGGGRSGGTATADVARPTRRGAPLTRGASPRSAVVDAGAAPRMLPRRRARPAPALPPRGGAPPMAGHGGGDGHRRSAGGRAKGWPRIPRHASEVLAKARADAAGRGGGGAGESGAFRRGAAQNDGKELEKKWPVQPPQQQRPPPPQRPLPPSTAAPSAPRAAPPNATAGPTTPAAAPAASTAASTAAAGTASTAASPASAASSTANDPTGQQAMRAHAANFAMQAAAAKAAAARRAQSSQQQQAHDQTRKAAATAGGQGAPSSSQPSKVKMTELLQVITDFLAGTNQHAKAAQVAETSAQYRSGTVSYQQAMLVLSEAVGGSSSSRGHATLTQGRRPERPEVSVTSQPPRGERNVPSAPR